MNPAPKKPNFFIVGAPKCGTTSLYEYLRQHPDVYMPHSNERYWLYKEPYYFCDELIDWPGLRIQDEKSYLSLFKSAGNEKCIGEATALYLFSQQAAKRIKNFAPEAKIIIMLRNPAEMMKAWHHDCVRWGHENVINFEQALSLENERKRGKQLPGGSGYPGCLLYSEMATFAPQIKRYFDVFGSASVKIVLLDDLANNPLRTYAEVTRFLEIEDSFIPSFEQHNQRKTVTTADLITFRLKRFLRSNAAWTKNLKPLIPSAFKNLYRHGISKIEKPINLPVVDLSLMKSLTTQMESGINQLGLLIDRDLSSWITSFDVNCTDSLNLAA